MKRMSQSLLVAFVCSLGACRSDSASRPTVEGADTAAIERFTEHYAKGFADEDIDALLASMTEDFTVLSHGRAPIEGRIRVADEIRGDFAKMRIHSLRFTNDDIVVHGDWAWVRGRSTASFTSDGDARPTDVRGTYLWILRRCPDSVWRIAVDSAHIAE